MPLGSRALTTPETVRRAGSIAARFGFRLDNPRGGMPHARDPRAHPAEPCAIVGDRPSGKRARTRPPPRPSRHSERAPRGAPHALRNARQSVIKVCPANSQPPRFLPPDLRRMLCHR
jgi:hypothetical protein